MLETANTRIDVDELMAKVREEVARRRQNGERSFAATLPEIKTASSASRSAGQGVGFEVRDVYRISDFAKFHQHGDFLHAAYCGLLRRSPDSQGFEHFLNLLRQGTSKVVILGRLRYSPEGRKLGVRIPGLALRFGVESAYRVPLFGYLLQLISAVARLPRVIEHLRLMQEASQHQVELKNLEIDRALGKIKQQITETDSTVETHSQDIQHQFSFLDAQRADLEARQQTVAKLLNELTDRLNRAHEQSFQNESYLKNDLAQQKRLIALFLEQAQKRLPQPFETQQLKLMVEEKQHDLDALYVAFEDRFRGSREDIKERLRVYLPSIVEASTNTGGLPVLDIGCGRGEWLELLKENNVPSRGVDSNRVMIEQCRERGLDAANGDAIAHLRSLPKDSLGVVTGFHIIEHLPFEILIELIDESLRALRAGGVMIFETPNPNNVLVGSNNFYHDPTHRNPLPSSLTKFLAEARGFHPVEVKDLHPYSDTLRLEGSEIAARFNDYFYGPQDYAVIAFKP